jgi:hypothetical protein
MKTLKTKDHMKVTWVMPETSIKEKPTSMSEIRSSGFNLNIELRISVAQELIKKKVK